MNESEGKVVTSWAPLVGQWKVNDGEVTYVGPQQETAHPFGICVSNVSLTEGVVSVSVALSQGTSGRILFGYQSPNEAYWTIGLGGYESAYVLSEFDPLIGWRKTSAWGSDKNLQYNQEYEVEVKVTGQRVRLLEAISKPSVTRS